MTPYLSVIRRWGQLWRATVWVAQRGKLVPVVIAVGSQDYVRRAVTLAFLRSPLALDENVRLVPVVTVEGQSRLAKGVDRAVVKNTRKR